MNWLQELKTDSSFPDYCLFWVLSVPDVQQNLLLPPVFFADSSPGYFLFQPAVFFFPD